ncbi:hypothetical protein FDP41_004124 [Naegleria fowleri]|uniref:G-protein coupled receptors family 1 profile domain-containing protein n=1 Tax=Naegleria fowleri TaxID=5763 RepID=A0A6A5BV71_NAEFO|nr:uncharacterized protein FDP41_004124 [Naegleria fowleri]KAF0976829.1 hypothetical protein FDP41_004124 [Naegleria fowleri]
MVFNGTTSSDINTEQPDILFLISQVVFVLLNLLSIIGSVIVFIVFFIESTHIFNTNALTSSSHQQGEEKQFSEDSNDLSGRIRNHSFSLTIRDHETGSLTTHYRTSMSASFSNGLINRKKKQFIRRTMLMLCVSDLLFSTSNILFTVWSWCTTYIPSLNVSDDNVSNISWIISHIFSHGNFAFALCSATWSVSIAIAIYTTTKKVKWMEENYAYDIIFHIVAWGVALITFTTVFSYRVASRMTGFHADHPVVESYLLTFFNFFGAFYLAIAAIVDCVVIVLIWRHVGTILSASQLRVAVKQETKRAQRRIIIKLSFYLLPFLLSSSCLIIWFFYNGLQNLVGRPDENFEYYFYIFFYNTLVPLQGFLNVTVYSLGLPSVRSSIVKLLRCQYCIPKRHHEERISLNTSSTIDYSDQRIE